MNDFFYSLMLLGGLSSSPQMPFWATAGQYGIMPDTPGALAVISAGTEFDPSRTLQWRFGTSLAVRSDALDSFELLPDELYASLRWWKLDLDLGFKHKERYFMANTAALGSVSSTSGNVVWSANARTMPGINLTLRPLDIPFTRGHLQLLGSWGDYATTDERVVRGAWIHNMQAFLRLNIGPVSFTAGVDHNAVWAGYSDQFGKMPNGIMNYLRMCVGDSGRADATLNDQYNVLGNQLGAERFRLDYRADGWTLSLQHDIPYDDRSGMRFQNFPDGVNTIAFSLDRKDAWISDVAYEWHYTMYQSGTMHQREATEEEKAAQDPSIFHYGYIILGGLDNYFNNGEYASGWTLHGRTIGNPLFYPAGTRDGSWSRKGMTRGVENNRIKAHHLGISGRLARVVPYKLMLTYSTNYGTYGKPYNGESQKDKPWGTVMETGLHQFSAGLQLEIPLGRTRLTLLPAAYLDRGEVLGNSFAATLGLRFQ